MSNANGNKKYDHTSSFTLTVPIKSKKGMSPSSVCRTFKWVSTCWGGCDMEAPISPIKTSLFLPILPDDVPGVLGSTS